MEGIRVFCEVAGGGGAAALFCVVILPLPPMPSPNWFNCCNSRDIGELGVVVTDVVPGSGLGGPYCVRIGCPVYERYCAVLFDTVLGDA